MDTPADKPAKKRGRPKFEPSDEARQFVAAMIGVGMTRESIARVVQCNIKTLERAFKSEIAAGRAELEGLVTSKYFEALKRGEQWAIQLGLKNFLGVRDDKAGVHVNIGSPYDNAAVFQERGIRFVDAVHKEGDTPPAIEHRPASWQLPKQDPRLRLEEPPTSPTAPEPTVGQAASPAKPQPAPLDPLSYEGFLDMDADKRRKLYSGDPAALALGKRRHWLS
jgi:hypothetical protein